MAIVMQKQPSICWFSMNLLSNRVLFLMISIPRKGSFLFFSSSIEKLMEEWVSFNVERNVEAAWTSGIMLSIINVAFIESGHLVLVF